MQYQTYYFIIQSETLIQNKTKNTDIFVFILPQNILLCILTPSNTLVWQLLCSRL